MEEQDRTEQTLPDDHAEGEDVEAHKVKPGARINREDEEGDDVEAHNFKSNVKPNVKP